MSRHFLVIGAQRSGTTYLHSLLEAHPDIAMARPARPEPKVFLSDELTDRGAEWYDATFFAHADPGQLLGDKSTSYLEDPAAPARARRMLADPGVVVVLRDPVERAVSNWRFSTDHGLETRPAEEALTANLVKQRGWDPATSSVSPYAYLERGRYVDHLVPWLEEFPDTQVLLLPELVDDPATANRLFEALGADASYAPSVGAPVNRSAAPRPQLTRELRERLEEYFSDSDAALAELLGRDLPWSRAARHARGGHHVA
ncbi:MAG TPA: sulfotransferase [Marmoricola sp.]|nr:sulfotransferase [Marmoricola sp.]